MQVSLRQDVEWPAFLRYNASRILDKMGNRVQGYDLFDILTTPTEQLLKVLLLPGFFTCSSAVLQYSSSVFLHRL